MRIKSHYAGHDKRFAAAADQGYPPEREDEESIEAIENLLESYFMQIDSCYDRLVSMGETHFPSCPHLQLQVSKLLLLCELYARAAVFAFQMRSMLLLSGVGPIYRIVLVLMKLLA